MANDEESPRNSGAFNGTPAGLKLAGLLRAAAVPADTYPGWMTTGRWWQPGGGTRWNRGARCGSWP
jgi:hypothetical protein